MNDEIDSQDGSKEVVIRKGLPNEMPKGNTSPDIFNDGFKKALAKVEKMIEIYQSQLIKSSSSYIMLEQFKQELQRLKEIKK